MNVTKRNFRLTQILASCIISMFAVFAFFTFSVHAQTPFEKSNPAAQDTFTQRARSRNEETPRSIRASGIPSLNIVQQPEMDARFISTHPYEVTQFQQAQRIGNIGLLAHNTLAGETFFNIPQGGRIFLTYSNGHIETFVVEEILAYQALPYGEYKNIKTNEVLGIGDLFEIVYGGAYHLTLQTCIQKEDQYEWGRLFIIAKPVEDFTAQTLLTKIHTYRSSR